MRERTLKARIKKAQTESISNILSRAERPTKIWWLSFAAADGFRGAVIVHAEDFTTAVMETNIRQINPHGEVQGVECPDEMAAKIPEHWKYRLLSRSDCEQFDKEMAS